MGENTNKSYTTPDGSVYRIESDGSVTKIKNGRTQQPQEGEPKYTVTPDGKIFMELPDGTKKFVGYAETKPAPDDLLKEVPPEKEKKSNAKLVWIILIILIVAGISVAYIMNKKHNDTVTDIEETVRDIKGFYVTSTIENRSAFIVDDSSVIWAIQRNYSYIPLAIGSYSFDNSTGEFVFKPRYETSLDSLLFAGADSISIQFKLSEIFGDCIEITAMSCRTNSLADKLKTEIIGHNAPNSCMNTSDIMNQTAWSNGRKTIRFYDLMAEIFVEDGNSYLVPYLCVNNRWGLYDCGMITSENSTYGEVERLLDYELLFGEYENEYEMFIAESSFDEIPESAASEEQYFKRINFSQF